MINARPHPPSISDGVDSGLENDSPAEAANLQPAVRDYQFSQPAVDAIKNTWRVAAAR